MGKEQGIPFNPADFGTRAEMGGQPQAGKQPEKSSLLGFAEMVVVTVGAIIVANAVVEGVKRRIGDFQREMRRPWPPPG